MPEGGGCNRLIAHGGAILRKFLPRFLDPPARARAVARRLESQPTNSGVLGKRVARPPVHAPS